MAANYAIAQTGERYLPWWETYATAYEHVHRYLLATWYAAGQRVLDIACGEGYGTTMLAQVARFVVGADVDAATVRHARQYHGATNIGFVQADAQQFALAPHSVDLVVSFETIEHFVAHKDFIQAVKSALTPDGILIVSSPNRVVYSEAPNRVNPFHARELSREEFTALLGRAFQHVQLLGQACTAVSVVGMADGDYFLSPNQPCRLAVTAVDPHQLSYPLQAASTFPPHYYIAVCSDRPLPASPDSVLVDVQLRLWKDLLQQVPREAVMRSLMEPLRQRLQATQIELQQAKRELALLRAQLGAAADTAAAQPPDQPS